MSEDLTTTDLLSEEDLQEVEAKVETALRENIADHLGDANPEGLDAAVRQALREPILDILLSVWRKWAKVRAYADPEKYSIEKPHVVPLFEHEVNSTFNPTITLLINEQEAYKVNFDLEVKIIINGVNLTITNKRITKVSSGVLQPSLQLMFNKKKIWGKAFPAMNFPGESDLGEGILLA